MGRTGIIVGFEKKANAMKWIKHPLRRANALVRLRQIQRSNPKPFESPGVVNAVKRSVKKHQKAKDRQAPLRVIGTGVLAAVAGAYGLNKLQQREGDRASYAPRPG